jgi:restriction endonuclease S subunit
MKLSSYLTERTERITPDHEDLEYEKVSKISFTGKIHLSTSTKSKTKMIVIAPNDLIISGINASKGAISINETGQMLCATIHYSSYEIDQTKVDLNFFSLLIKSSLFNTKLNDMVRGGIKTELKAKHILEMDITLPSISDQRKIMQDYYGVKESIANDYFKRYDPKRIRRIKEQLYDRILFDGIDFDPSIPLPCNLFDSLPIAEVLSDGPKNGFSPNPVNKVTNNKVLSLSATTSEDFNADKIKYFNGIVSDSLVIKAGDIFVQRGNSRDFVGVTAFCRTPLESNIIYPDLMMRLRTNEKIEPEFLVYFLNSGNVRRFFRHKAKGTVDTMVKINQSVLLSLYVPLLHPGKQKEILERIRSVRHHLLALEDCIHRVNKSTDTVLMKYFEKKINESLI